MQFQSILLELPSSTEIGLIYALVAIGVYLTYRILDFPDLTVETSFATGGATVATAIVAGINPVVGMGLAFVAGCVAGTVTGLLHAKGGINALLAGIITMVGLYSINLHIMQGRAVVPLLGKTTVLTPLEEAGFMRVSWIGSGILAIFVAIVGVIIIWFLHTRLGLALRSTGDNERMAASFRVDTDVQKIVGVALSNGIVAIAGALLAQYQGLASASMGIGVIIIGLASVIVGQAIFGQRRVWQAVLAVALGAVLYRWALQLAMSVGLPPQDMKIASAAIVAAALLLPRMAAFQRFKAARIKRRQQRAEKSAAKSSSHMADG